MKYIFFLLTLSLPVSAQMSLDSLFSRYHEFVLRAYPESASLNGDHRYDDMLTDVSPEGHAARLDSIRWFLKVAKAYEDDTLSAEQRLNKQLFVYSLQQDVDQARFNNWMMPLSQQSGIQIDLPMLALQLRLESHDDWQNYLHRLRLVPDQIVQTKLCMELGMKRHIMPPKVIMQRVADQLQALVEKPLEKQSFYRLPSMSGSGSDTEVQSIGSDVAVMQSPGLVPPPPKKDAFDDDMRDACRNVVTAYEKLLTFVRTRYLPECREDVGMWSMPDGLDRYEACLQAHTSVTQLEAQEVFDLGQRELARIEKQMMLLRKKMHIRQSAKDFHEELRTSTLYHYQNKEELLDAFRQILTTAQSKLPTLFMHLPSTPCEVKELEEFRSETAPQAYYYSAPEDLSRPAYFYVNTTHLEMRPKYTMTALTLHEAVPGHHLQISLAQENKHLPWFRQQMSVTAFVEGWALYAESLGENMQMYDDPLQKYGELGFEAWRACRLVVDAGIHAKRWTRDQAIAFMNEHTINSRADIISEVERYIAWPGQACAYKIGQLKILALREEAQRALGEKFSLPAFHDVVLRDGAIPLPMLEEHVHQWIQQQLHR